MDFELKHLDGDDGQQLMAPNGKSKEENLQLLLEEMRNAEFINFPSSSATTSSSSEDLANNILHFFNQGAALLQEESGEGDEPGMSGKTIHEFMEMLSRQMKNGSLENVPSLEMSAEEQLALNILYGAAIAVAVGGNLAVILVFLFGRRWNSDLSIFLVNLAFSDIVLSVFCMPFTMAQVVKHHWPFSSTLCPIVLFLQLSSVLASVYTLVAIGVDRYLFVTRPLKKRLTKRKGKMVIVMIWIFSLALSSVQLAVVRCSKFVHDGKVYKDCQEAWPNENYRKVYTVTVALLTYVIPLSLLMYTYIAVGLILWQRTPPGETVIVTSISSMSRAEERRVKSKQRVVKMLVVIVLVFAICWFPLHLFFLTIDFFPEVVNLWRDYLHEHFELSFTYTFLTIHFLAMSSSYVNPLIYSFMNQNFRSDVRQLWFRASSAVKRWFRRLARKCKDGYDDSDDEDDEDSLKPFRQSPNSLLKRSSSTAPPLQQAELIAKRIPSVNAPYPALNSTIAAEHLRAGCSWSEAAALSGSPRGSESACQSCTRKQSKSKSRSRSSGRASKEDTYG